MPQKVIQSLYEVASLDELMSLIGIETQETQRARLDDPFWHDVDEYHWDQIA